MLRAKYHVAPYVGAWIETQSYMTEVDSADVAPYVGAWIETIPSFCKDAASKSHPTWVRGLKHTNITNIKDIYYVAPYVGAWIETRTQIYLQEKNTVAPYVGAWIETSITQTCTAISLVAPYVGAWIETYPKPSNSG